MKRYAVKAIAELFVKSCHETMELQKDRSVSKILKSIVALKQSDIKEQLNYEFSQCCKLSDTITKEIKNLGFLLNELGKAEEFDTEQICKISEKIKRVILIVNKKTNDLIARIDKSIYYIDKKKVPYKSTIIMLAEIEDDYKKKICQKFIDKCTPEIKKLDHIRRQCIQLSRQLKDENKERISIIVKYNALKDLI